VKRQVAEHEAFDVGVLACMLDIDADQADRLVKIKHDPVGHLIAIRAGALCEVDVERIGIRVLGNPHGAIGAGC